tara:strand:- start:892 stop:2097 length:1206 start_codon:yes stop_codon:yes gene_type:complete
MKKQNTIVIVGAGIVGILASILLRKSKIPDETQIIIVEKSDMDFAVDKKEIDIRVSAISSGSIEILKKINLWRNFDEERLFRFENMRVWDGSEPMNSYSTINFCADEYGSRELGFIIENSQIQSKLFEMAKKLNIIFYKNCIIERVDYDSAINKTILSLSNSETIESDLLIGADGINSKIRSLKNIKMSEYSYHQSAFVTHVQSEKDHEEIAYQRFLKEGPIALLPLGEKKVSIVWSTSPTIASKALKLNNDKLSNLLTEKSDFALGNLKIISKSAIFPLRYQHAKHYIANQFALIGDAAHSIHPLAGQGVNMGIADAYDLYKVIEESYEKGQYIGDTSSLRPYERKRRAANSLMLDFVDFINRLFSANYESLSGIRKLGMRFFNRTIPLKNKAIKIALNM